MSKFVVINEELRIDDVKDFDELIGDNSEEQVKSKGFWKIDKGAKQILFYGGLKPKDLNVLSTVKNSGFYTPLIQGYRWIFSEDFEFDSMQYIDII